MHCIYKKQYYDQRNENLMNMNKNLENTILNIVINYLNESTSTNGFELREILKKLPYLKYVDRPSGRFHQSIDIVIEDNKYLNDLKDILKTNNWYLERSSSLKHTITKKNIEDAIVDIPSVLYHLTPTKKVKNIIENGLEARSEDVRHKYPKRIYVSSDINSLKGLSKEFKQWYGDTNYSIIEINTNGLNFNLYIDDTSAYSKHYYIQGIDKIPPQNLRLVNSI